MKLLNIAALILLFAIAGCATSRTKNMTFRVLTYNIHHGEGIEKKIDLQRIADLINREKADIVGLQEVDRGVERTARRDLPAELAQLTGMTVYFDRNIIHQGATMGMQS